MAAVTEVPRVARVSDARRTQPFGLGTGGSISVASALVTVTRPAIDLSDLRFMLQIA